jgi:hypothetical protein
MRDEVLEDVREPLKLLAAESVAGEDEPPDSA